MENHGSDTSYGSGLRSFNLHTARCPCRDYPFEALDRCPTTLPLASGFMNSFNKTREGTAEDRTNGLVIKDGNIELHKDIMTRHLERRYSSPFYGESLGACISKGIKEQLRTKLSIEPSAQKADG